MPDLFAATLNCLRSTGIQDKLQQTRRLQEDWAAGRLSIPSGTQAEPLACAGLPPDLQLVHPRDLPRRSLATDSGRAALIHAVAHIEYNAINLALDAVYRFRDMPPEYYGDWVQVAAEEALHFELLAERLAALGHEYGDYPGHMGLWDMAQRTADDPLVRMALVPRVLEARGLDVTPGMIRRFRGAGDEATARVLEVIFRDEVGHVAIGTRWYQYLCRKRGLESEATYFRLLDQYLGGEIRGPVHREARIKAGFSETEITQLEARCEPSGR